MEANAAITGARCEGVKARIGRGGECFEGRLLPSRSLHIKIKMNMVIPFQSS